MTDHLGDLTSLDGINSKNAGDFLCLQGRTRNRIFSGGVNIYPAELENAVSVVKGVDDRAVFVVGWNLEAYTVRWVLRQALAGCIIPRAIVVIDHIERDASGKFRKYLLPSKTAPMAAGQR